MASLAASRSRRANAGANMSKLLDQEEAKAEDEFYKTQYGGFDEIENDSDFDDSNSSDSENVIDSDFDIEENQAADEDDEDVTEKALQAEERESRRKKTVYKDPKAKKPKQKVLTKKKSTPAAHAIPSTSSSSSSTPTTTRSPRKKPIPKSTSNKRYLSEDESLDGLSSVSKNLRKSTQKSSQDIRDLLDERKRQKKKKHVNKEDYRVLTQEEMLKEAKKTEIENTRSLEAYKNMEIEKVKKVKAKSILPNVPMIRYHSYTEYDGGDEGVDENGEGSKENNPNSRKKYSRTIITFPSEESFREHFPSYRPPVSELESIIVTKPKSTQEQTSDKANGTAMEIEEDSSTVASAPSVPIRKPRERRMCPITHQPAKYFDPLTQTPYANADAFRMIRASYARYLEQSPDCAHLKDDPRMKKFLEKHAIKTKTQFTVPINNSSRVIRTSNVGALKVTTIRPVPGATVTLPSRVLPVVPVTALNARPIAGMSSGIICTTTKPNTPMTFPTLTFPPGAKTFFIQGLQSGGNAIIIPQGHQIAQIQQQQQQQLQQQLQQQKK